MIISDLSPGDSFTISDGGEFKLLSLPSASSMYYLIEDKRKRTYYVGKFLQVFVEIHDFEMEIVI